MTSEISTPWLFFNFFIFWLLIKLARGIWTTWLGSSLGFGYKLKPELDAYAVITGATDGIGLEYSKYFARKGYNVLLISRNAQKLEQAREQVQAATGAKQVQVKVHQADFTSTSIYDSIESAINALPRVEVLVNNVGVSFEHPEYLDKIIDSRQVLASMVNVNMMACTQMLSIVLPIMAKQRKGLVLNIASFSAAYPCPLLSVYGASKTYVDYLSRALSVEYAKSNIVFQSVLPAFVATKMAKIRSANLMAPSPASYVASQMRTVGFEARTYGYWVHKVQGFVLDNIVAPVAGAEMNARIQFNSLLKLRQRVYKKKQIKDE